MLRRGFFGTIVSGLVCFLFPRKSKADTDRDIKMCFSPRLANSNWQIASQRREFYQWKSKVRGCLLDGPRRGDCLHYIGLPDKEDETTTDVYGRPHGWCEVCWQGEQIYRLSRALYQNFDNENSY